MKKNEFNYLFRDHTRKSLSPTQQERDFVTQVYEHICSALNNNCVQIGSYPRFTSIRPLHDLDILYIIGDMTSFVDKPETILFELQNTLQNYFRQNTNYKLKISLQTHSATISFLDERNEEYFTADIVPAFVNGKNEFGLDMYLVPEIVRIGRSKRSDYYKFKSTTNSLIQWIKSDPRGYIEIAKNINTKNDDYRKAVKFAKKWKHNAATNNENFKFKSFHIEQVFVEIFQRNPNIEMFDAIFEFFCHLPEYITHPQIKDRADNNIFIDSYLNELSGNQKELIKQAKDRFLIALEEFASDRSILDLLSGQFYKRFSCSEAYLFDSFIPTFIDGQKFRIDGWIRKKDGFRSGWLSEINWKLETERFIDFSVKHDETDADFYKWKVKNSNSAPQPRGEITNHNTKNTPESTKYLGNHYVECYAIKDNVCIAKHRVGVPIG